MHEHSGVSEVLGTNMLGVPALQRSSAQTPKHRSLLVSLTSVCPSLMYLWKTRMCSKHVILGCVSTPTLIALLPCEPQLSQPDEDENHLGVISPSCIHTEPHLPQQVMAVGLASQMIPSAITFELPEPTSTRCHRHQSPRPGLRGNGPWFFTSCHVDTSACSGKSSLSLQELAPHKPWSVPIPLGRKYSSNPGRSFRSVTALFGCCD